MNKEDFNFYFIVFGAMSFALFATCAIAGIYPDTEYHNEIITGKHMDNAILGEKYYFEFDMSYWQNSGEDKQVNEEEYNLYNISEHYQWSEIVIKSIR